MMRRGLVIKRIKNNGTYYTITNEGINNYIEYRIWASFNQWDSFNKTYKEGNNRKRRINRKLRYLKEGNFLWCGNKTRKLGEVWGSLKHNGACCPYHDRLFGKMLPRKGMCLVVS